MKYNKNGGGAKIEYSEMELSVPGANITTVEQGLTGYFSTLLGSRLIDLRNGSLLLYTGKEAKYQYYNKSSRTMTTLYNMSHYTSNVFPSFDGKYVYCPGGGASYNAYKIDNVFFEKLDIEANTTSLLSDLPFGALSNMKTFYSKEKNAILFYINVPTKPTEDLAYGIGNIYEYRIDLGTFSYIGDGPSYTNEAFDKTNSILSLTKVGFFTNSRFYKIDFNTCTITTGLVTYEQIPGLCGNDVFVYVYSSRYIESSGRLYEATDILNLITGTRITDKAFLAYSSDSAILDNDHVYYFEHPRINDNCTLTRAAHPYHRSNKVFSMEREGSGRIKMKLDKSVACNGKIFAEKNTEFECELPMYLETFETGSLSGYIKLNNNVKNF